MSGVRLGNFVWVAFVMYELASCYVRTLHSRKLLPCPNQIRTRNVRQEQANRGPNRSGQRRLMDNQKQGTDDDSKAEAIVDYDKLLSADFGLRNTVTLKTKKDIKDVIRTL